MKPLDFLVVGAQKCATTALFEYFRSHPDIVMPLEKEVPFFTGQDYSQQSWDAFANEQFGPGQQNKLWAKVSPQYMSDSKVPARIKELMPDVKVVAILRDPMERTWSHFQMARRRDTEQREFAQVIAALLTEEALHSGRSRPVPDHTQGYESEADFYIAWSEYGRILTKFTTLFESKQLLVLYTEDLESEPEQTLDRLMEFVGLPTGFRPATMGEVIHRGGGSHKRIPQSVREWLRNRNILYWLWLRVPKARRGRLRFQYEQWNIRRSSNSQSNAMLLSEELHEQLRRHYSADIDSLLSLPIAPPPWLDRYLVSS